MNMNWTKDKPSNLGVELPLPIGGQVRRERSTVWARSGAGLSTPRGKAAVRLFPLALRPIQRGNVTNSESTQRNTVAAVPATVSFPSSFNIWVILRRALNPDEAASQRTVEVK
jgi:hypothetical protein